MVSDKGRNIILKNYGVHQNYRIKKFEEYFYARLGVSGSTTRKNWEVKRYREAVNIVIAQGPGLSLGQCSEGCKNLLLAFLVFL